jgi:hypothetical protein
VLRRGKIEPPHNVLVDRYLKSKHGAHGAECEWGVGAEWGSSVRGGGSGAWRGRTLLVLSPGQATTAQRKQGETYLYILTVPKTS